MKFDDVLYLLRRGERLKRKDKDWILIYIPPCTSMTADGQIVTLTADIRIKHPGGALDNWTPTVLDVLAQDWEIVSRDAT